MQFRRRLQGQLGRLQLPGHLEVLGFHHRRSNLGIHQPCPEVRPHYYVAVLREAHHLNGAKKFILRARPVGVGFLLLQLPSQRPHPLLLIRHPWESKRRYHLVERALINGGLHPGFDSTIPLLDRSGIRPFLFLLCCLARLKRPNGMTRVGRQFFPMPRDFYC